MSIPFFISTATVNSLSYPYAGVTWTQKSAKTEVGQNIDLDAAPTFISSAFVVTLQKIGQRSVSKNSSKNSEKVLLVCGYF